MRPFKTVSEMFINKTGENYNNPIIRDDAPEVQVLQGYMESRKKELPKYPKYYIIQDGLISKREMERLDIMKADDDEKSKIWDRAVALYPKTSLREYNMREILPLATDRRFVGGKEWDSADGKNEAYDLYRTLVIYIDRGMLDYLYKQYWSLENGKEIVYQFLDKNILPKIKIAADCDIFYKYIYNNFLALASNEYIYKAFTYRLDVSYDNDRVDNENLKYDVIKTFVTAYLYYMYNENVIRGCYKLNILERFRAYMTTISVADASWVACNGLLNMRDSLGMNDSVINRLLANSLIDSKAGINENSGIRRNGFNSNSFLISLAREWNSIKRIGVALIPDKEPCKDAPCPSTKVAYAESRNKFNFKSLDGGYLEKIGADFSQTPARVFSEALIYDKDRSLHYFSEFLGIQLSKTNTEVINGLSRKVDQVLIMFESMTNQWNKLDAMNAAYDLLNKIDDAASKPENANIEEAIGGIRKQLSDAIVSARKHDVQKGRMTLNISYPKGFEG